MRQLKSEWKHLETDGETCLRCSLGSDIALETDGREAINE